MFQHFRSALHTGLGVCLVALLGSTAAQARTVYLCEGEDQSNRLVERTEGHAVCAPLNQPASPAASQLAHAAAGQIQPQLNIFEFHSSKALERLQAKWNTPNARIAIAHFGDSLLQNGYAIDSIRKTLASAKPSAGRGMVFPYTIARTYSQYDYSSQFEGSWTTANSIQPFPKLPLGLSGFSAHTSDPAASFAFQFKTPLAEGPKKLRLFLKVPATGYRLILTVDKQYKIINLDPVHEQALPYVDVDVAQLSDDFRFEVIHTNADNGVFELHGVSIENAGAGVIYHNLGVGGAAFNALNAQALFARQLPGIAPDVVVLDWGTNDILYKNAVPANHAEVVLRTLEKVRASAPEALIVLTSVQDMNFRGKNITAARQYAQLMRQLAFENDCLFYDWYRVSGGANTMRSWVAQGLASKDNIHLNERGYRIKGRAFGQAFLQTLEFNRLYPQTGTLEIQLPAARSGKAGASAQKNPEQSARSAKQGANKPTAKPARKKR
jgi:lysophospholipase L1-like esterase